jgi:hypothetical protein
LHASHTSPVNSFSAETQKTTFKVIKVPLNALEAFRKTEPLFTEFLIETGRVVVENTPVKSAVVGGRDHYGVNSNNS